MWILGCVEECYNPAGELSFAKPYAVRVLVLFFVDSTHSQLIFIEFEYLMW